MPVNPNKFPSKISAPFVHNFTTDTNGIYLITLAARASGKEDLRVEIDGRKFREIPEHAKPQYYDIPPAWNGTKLAGRKQTIIFVMGLSRGNHALTFIPDGSATVEAEPRIL